MGRLFDEEEAPHCPVCDGPCTHDFERGPFVFPDRLPKATDGAADPVPEKAKKQNRRGRRPEQHTKNRPTEDRMVRPDEDR